MDECKKRLIHLLHCKLIGWKAIYTILKADPSLTSIYSPSFFKSVLPNGKFSPALLQQVPIDHLLEHYDKNKIQLISYFDKEYRARLKNIYQAPWLLYSKGDSTLLNNNFPLAVVGSREATEYGKKVIDFLFPELIAHGAVIISGLAKGIDTHAHQSALKFGGNTIGVIAGGFAHIYPKQNLPLAEKMMNEQLLVSEYPPSTKPEKWQFPLRNRIISGLAKGTVVIEAKKRSGSFITADFALNEGREVFAVPGNILFPGYEGTNELIQLGAKLVKKPKDIIEEIFPAR